ncbi:MAG: hypothetical protein LBI13_08560 [Streptococcaceae bacterium]|jgi:hypothetical protein|nr:hypothetical protein [Streptococcaceae bacterium]
MEIFYLDDNPSPTAMPYLNGHNVTHVRRLQGADACLRIAPGVKNFNKFLFDAKMPVEQINETAYDYHESLNGLLYLLSNLNLLGTANNPEQVAIITAYGFETKILQNICTTKTVFRRIEIPREEQQIYFANNQSPKIRYKDEGKGRIHTFSLLDTGTGSFSSIIGQFLLNG